MAVEKYWVPHVRRFKLGFALEAKGVARDEAEAVCKVLEVLVEKLRRNPTILFDQNIVNDMKYHRDKREDPEKRADSGIGENIPLQSWNIKTESQEAAWIGGLSTKQKTSQAKLKEERGQLVNEERETRLR